MAQSAVPARDGYDEYDRVRQCQVRRAGHDDDRPTSGLLRSEADHNRVAGYRALEEARIRQAMDAQAAERSGSSTGS